MSILKFPCVPNSHPFLLIPVLRKTERIYMKKGRKEGRKEAEKEGGKQKRTSLHLLRHVPSCYPERERVVFDT